MGLFDFLKAKKDRFAISLDIGTEFVKTLIFEVVEDKALVKGVGIERQKLSDMAAGGVTDIQGVIKNCESSLAQAVQKAKILPEQVIIGIAGELVKGTTITIKYSRENPKEKITLRELQDIIARVQRRAFDRARGVLAWETGQAEIDIRLVNAAITDVKIDGYKVTNPLGFVGREVQVGVFNAFAPIVHLEALQTIAESLELDLLSIAAEPYAVARSVTPEEEVDFSAIFIDVGGGTSDIAVVRGGGVEGTKMFALGGRAFTKRLSQEFGMPFSEAEELKLDYSAGKLPEEKADKIRTALSNDCRVWFAGVELTLSEFPNIDLLPSRIYLCGGGSELPDIKEMLEKASWSKKLPFARRPTITYIKPQYVTNVIDETKKLTKPRDITPMALANLAIELVGSQGVVGGTLNKVVSSLGK